METNLVIVAGPAATAVATTYAWLSPVLQFLSATVTAVIAFFMWKVSRDTKDIPKAAAIVSEKVDKLAVVADATHALTNSAMLGQLRLTYVAFQRIADLTKEEADMRAADEAKRLYDEHKSQQDKVDLKYPAGVPKAATVIPVGAGNQFSSEQREAIRKIIEESK